MGQDSKRPRWFFTRLIVLNVSLLMLINLIGIHNPYDFFVLMSLHLLYGLLRYVQDRLSIKQEYKKTIDAQAKLFGDDQIPDLYSVSAALQILADKQGDDVEAANLILRFISRMPAMEVDANEYTEKKSQGGSFRGFTAEMGDVEIRGDKEGEPQLISHGFNRERVGQFVLTRDDVLLVYRYFWKATFMTAGRLQDLADGHAVLFDPETMEYLGFANLVLIGPTEDSPRGLGLEIVYGLGKGTIHPLDPLM